MSALGSSDAENARAVLYRNVREFFLSRNIVEVEESLFPFNPSVYQSSIFHIGQQFREETIDRRHLTKFSVLQWRQPNRSKDQILSDVDVLLSAIFSGEFEPERRTFRQAFIQRLGFDPDELSVVDLRQEARRLGLNVSLGEDRLAWLKLMFVHFIEPTLGIDIPLYLTELPNQWRDTKNDGGALIRSDADIFIDGIKVGSVLTDTQFDAEPQQQIVLGLDRLLMIVLETRQIEKVLSVV